MTAAATAAWTTMTVLIGVPAMIAAVAVAGWRYHLEFELRWMLVPAVLLTACTATLIGYALAHTVGNSMITMSVTQVLTFVVIGFSPVNFPADRLPGWLDRLHDWLPFKPMATVVRDALAPDLAHDVGRVRRAAGLVARDDRGDRGRTRAPEVTR